MKALTLSQPWATLCIARLVRALHQAPNELHRQHAYIRPGFPPKLNETRDWKVPGTLTLPMRVAITAGKGDGGMRGSIVRGGALIEPYATALNACGYWNADPWSPGGREQPPGLKPLPLGCVIGVVTVVECWPTTALDAMVTRGLTHAMDQLLGDWSPGRWAWEFAHQVELPAPIPCRGLQKLWTLPRDLEELVVEGSIAAGHMEGTDRWLS